jgi:hypothetical protein
MKAAWERIEGDFVKLLSLHPDLPLDDLSIGSRDNSSLPVPIHLLHLRDTEQPFLTMLERLDLLGIDTSEEFPPAMPSTCIMLLPSMLKLKALVYSGDGHDGISHFKGPLIQD